MSAQRACLGGGGRVADFTKKVLRALRGRGQMTSLVERGQVIVLVAEAMSSGVRQGRACAAITLSERTLQRWQRNQSSGD